MAETRSLIITSRFPQGPGRKSKIVLEMTAMQRRMHSLKLVLFAFFFVSLSFAVGNAGTKALAQSASSVSAGPGLVCSLNAPPISVDTIRGEYTPMPFAVTLALTNQGGVTIDVAYARIAMLPDLKLAGPDSLQPIKVPADPSIDPGITEYVTWLVSHPPIPSQKQYTIVVEVKTSNGSDRICSLVVQIPSLDPPELEAECAVPLILRWNQTMFAYDGDPFLISVKAKNIGEGIAKDVRAKVQLPEGMQFADPTESNEKYFNPTELIKYRSGDVVPEIFWEVHYTELVRYNRNATFTFTISGNDQAGKAIPDAVTQCNMGIEGVDGLLECLASVDDTLRQIGPISDEKTFEAEVQFQVRNFGSEAVSIATAEIMFDSPRLKLISPDTLQVVQKTVAPGEVATVEWLVEVDIATVAEEDTFDCILTDDQSNLLTCTQNFVLPAVETTDLLCGIGTDVPEVVYNKETGAYEPEEFPLELVLQNLDITNHENAIAEITISNPPGGPWVELDTAGTNPKEIVTFSTIVSESDTTATWFLRILKINRNCEEVQIPIEFTVSSDQGGTSRCETVLILPPVHPEQPLQASLSPDTSFVAFDIGAGEYPDKQFTVRGTIENIGPCPLENVVADISWMHPKHRSMIGLEAIAGNMTPDTIPLIPANSSRDVEWKFELKKENNSGQPVVIPFSMKFYADGTPLDSVGGSAVKIEQTTTTYDMLCNLTVSDPLVAWDSTEQAYMTNEWTVTADLINLSNVDVTNIQVLLSWVDTSGLDLIAVKTGTGLLSNPAALPIIDQNSTEFLTWRMILANPNTLADPYSITYAVTVTTSENDFGTLGCTDTTIVEEQRLTNSIHPTLPDGITLLHNAPNPFRDGTVIYYELSKAMPVRIIVYDMLGRTIAELANGFHAPGKHQVQFNGNSIHSGMFIYVLESPEGRVVRTMQRAH